MDLGARGTLRRRRVHTKALLTDLPAALLLVLLACWRYVDRSRNGVSWQLLCGGLVGLATLLATQFLLLAAVVLSSG